MKYGHAVDHICSVPAGKVCMGKARPNNVTREQRKTAERRSFVATNKMRAKLNEVQVVQHDSSWAHVYRGEVMAVFATVSEAVAALN